MQHHVQIKGICIKKYANINLVALLIESELKILFSIFYALGPRIMLVHFEWTFGPVGVIRRRFIGAPEASDETR